MADDRLKIKQLEALYKQQKEIADKEIESMQKQKDSLNELLNIRKRMSIQREIDNKREESANQMQEIFNKALENGNKITKNTEEAFKRRVRAQKEGLDLSGKELNNNKNNLNILTSINNQLIKRNWLQTGFIKYLNESDKIIRQTTLSLGLSSVKAELMRTSFEESAQQVAHLGGSLTDIQMIMQGYADETGRARVLTANMINDIELIGKGTSIGVEQATKLGAQFELMGFDAKTTMEYVQGVVDTSERMGVNTTKVLKNVSDNFKKLNTYTFQQGVKGFAQMAQYAEKMKVDINQALNAADVAKSLEGAIDLAAQLQIMGGEFAKTDPFQLLFLSRNDPAKFTEKIVEMTKGVVSFRKMSDGTFEKFISPADRDRLAAVAKSLGMETTELTQIAERTADIQKMRQQMLGLGLSPREKELIEGAAIFNKESGKFQVLIAGKMKDISTLSKADATLFDKQTISLKQRAEAAQDFETALKSTIEEFKIILLPMLRGFNTILEKWRPFFEKAANFLSEPKWIKTMLIGFGTFSAAVMTFGAVTKGFLNTVGGELARNIGGKIFSGGAKTISTTGGATGGNIIGGTANAGKGVLRSGAGVGAAAVGIGAGVGIGAVGISKLADSLSKLTPKQAETLKSIANTLAITFPLAAIGIAVVAAVAAPAAVPLLALGAALLMMGAAVGVAAAGIGFMATGFSKLVTSSKGAGKDMKDVGLGIGVISLALAGLSTGVIGLAVFAGLMKTISKNAPAIAQVGNAFKEIKTVMSGSKDDYIAIQNAIESISKLNVKGGTAFSDLANLLKSPLKVEFANKQVAIVSDITLNIDGQKFMQKIYNPKIAIQNYEDTRIGKG